MEKYFEKKQDTNQIISFGETVPFRRKKKIFMEYGGNYNFGGLRPNIVIDQDSLIDKIQSNICDTKDKWMVFVDSIDAGKVLQKALRCNSQIKDSDIVFIDADYEKAEEADKTVKEIVENKSSRKRVIISTAVMDNGITFQDSDLVNIAIFSDVKETFVQMLGRKRLNDNEIIHLYICKRSEEHFRKRYQYVHNAVSTYFKYQNELNILSKPYCYRKNNCSQIAMLSYSEVLYRYRGIGASENLERYFSQQKILDVLLSNTMETQYLKRFCYAVNGNISLNNLAIQRLLDLEAYYKKMAEKLADNENAFVEQQFEWLGISTDAVQEYVDEAIQELSTRYRNGLKQSIEDILNKRDGIMTEEENIAWKLKMRDPLEYFLVKDDEYDENERKDLGKNDRALSTDRFNSEMKKADLHYVMKRKGTKEKLRYIIQRIN